jgi:hypothetical protein
LRKLARYAEAGVERVVIEFLQQREHVLMIFVALPKKVSERPVALEAEQMYKQDTTLVDLI